ncbi:hypothetical protein CCU68_02845 [Pseudomonas gingeri NCPPB 3146 = LMG 5327]|uniref:Uncharacterized protein n=2 Tax=Pseudomonas gingeri TaxID=117681 RepID=A0A7Y8CH28_9PSED|nr:hypothetical protein [Pseudomonas gingeri]NWC17831.1 hypothetical protein [Pseudomonas gingeri]PNQ94125.1 hypothetical protein CCU68_02845 [Pseudomonas gingeri NCPPB 3146 = LMG 5327]
MTDSKTLELPPPIFAGNMFSCNSAGTPACQEPRVDAVHITGDDTTFYVLSYPEQRRLIKAIEVVEALMKAFQKIIQSPPQEAQSCKAGGCWPVETTCDCEACQKLAWARKAEQAGLLSLHQAQVQAEEVGLTEAEDIQGRISELRERKQQFEKMCGWLSSETTCTISQKVVQTLETEIAALKGRLESAQKSAGMIATDTVPDAAMGAKVISSSSFTQARGDKGVVEIIVLSRPDRRYYISETAADELRSSMRVQAGRLPVPRRLDNAGLKARAGELVKDIQREVGQRIREDLAKPLGNLEVRLKSWEFPQDSAINALHQEFDWPSQNRNDDEARYAVDREAHFLRFAAQASAGFSGFDPKAGTVSLGVKGQASFALAEGKITFSHFLPNQGGRDCFIAYKDAAGQRAYHRFGAFRLRGAVELSCFSGITASGSGTVGVKWKPAPSGASVLLLSPELDARGGKVQLKGNGLIGAQLGGSLTGGLEWMAPALQHRPNAPWAPLVEVRTEGNVAYGVGRTGDFQVILDSNRLYLYCKGQLVFGWGAGGGFGTLVDFEKVAELVGVVYQALSEVNFRHLLGINQLAFELFYQGVSKLLSEPGKTLNEVMGQGPRLLEAWWEARRQAITSSQRLAERILSDQPLQLGSQLIPLSQLPPEVLGPALHQLSEYYLSALKDETERAIVHLLKQISSWRQFYLVLERMHPTAQVVPAEKGVERIRSYLSGPQDKEFSNFIKNLAAHTDEAVPGQPLLQWQPWQPLHVNYKFDTLVAARKFWAQGEGRYV